MGADLFGSFAESTCAALSIASTSPSFYNDGFSGASLYYPLMITAFGIIASFLTSFFATNFMKVDHNEQIEHTLKIQLVVSTILLTPALYGAAALSLPDEIIFAGVPVRHPVHAWICSVAGLWAGLIIGYFTEYMTSHTYTPVREVTAIQIINFCFFLFQRNKTKNLFIIKGRQLLRHWSCYQHHLRTCPRISLHHCPCHLSGSYRLSVSQTFGNVWYRSSSFGNALQPSHWSCY
jgi:hypothetical protein